MTPGSWWVKALKKPEYIWQPRRGLARVGTRLGVTTLPAEQTIVLPWGYRLTVDTREVIGRNLAHMGVHDLAVSEVLWRLQDPEDIAIDVGANIGYMTALMASRARGCGQVHAFEPHPNLYRKLHANLGLWPKGQVYVHRLALSETSGTGWLEEPEGFASNHGLARISGSTQTSARLSIQLVRLDEWYAGRPIGVMKLDVEDHELSVLHGAQSLLRERLIRDIVFEDLGAYPTPITDYLKDFGYTVTKIDKGLLGPEVRPARTGVSHRSFAAPSFLATIEQKRAYGRLRAKGWRCLSQTGISDR